MHIKYEALDMFTIYKAKVKNQLERKIWALGLDREGDFKLKAFSNFCIENIIVHQTTSSYTPQQNDIVECKNRTFKDMINSMPLSSRR